MKAAILPAIILCVASSTVRAADPLGLYVGAGTGRSEVRSNLGFDVFGPQFSGPFDFSGKPTGWKLIAGIRPLPILGAEAEYIDFGSVSGAASIPATPLQGGLNATATAHPRAAALFAVGYLPIPVPFIDVFAKAGVAAFNSHAQASAEGTCPIGVPPCGGLPLPILLPTYSADSTHARFAYGAGVQGKVGSFAVRAEYERISAATGDVDMLSLDLTFGF